MTARWSFPVRVDARGRSVLVGPDEHARELVNQVLFTAPGERVVRPTFGSGLDQLLFVPAGDALATATEATVRSAMARWLADVVEVRDVAVAHDEGRLTIEVAYRVLATGSSDRVRLVTTGGAT